MLYIDPAIIVEWASDIDEERTSVSLEFNLPAISDQRMASLFRKLFHAMTCSDAEPNGLKADEALWLLLGGLLLTRTDDRRLVPAGIASARALIDDDPAAVLTLATLAREAKLSRYQFLRSFARATGLTPHAYVMQRRIHRARQLIGSGVQLAEAAANSGFSDQSHMTRLFTRSFGMAPGTYAKAMG